MSDDILTQDEINALLASFANEQDEEVVEAAKPAANTASAPSLFPGVSNIPPALNPSLPAAPETVNGKPLKVYDFSRPDKFSKDQIRTLQLLHETFARYYAASLSAHLRTPVRIEVTKCKQCIYDEFLASLTAPTVINILTASPLEGRLILHYNTNLAFAMINRILGGPWRNTWRRRELTEIEQNLMNSIVLRAFEDLKLAWRGLVPIEPKLVGYESDPQFAQILAPNDTVCLISFELQMGGLTRNMSLCMPYAALQPIISKLNAQQWFMDPQRYSSQRQNSRKVGLDEAALKVSVELGQANVSVKDLLELEVGDVIRLNAKKEEPLTIKVGHLPKFKGVPGMVGSQMAVRITDVKYQNRKTI